MMNQEVRTIMTKDPVVTNPSQTIGQVTNLMMTSGLQQLPVVDDNNKLQGMITAYDLWQGQRQQLSDDTPISQVMNSKVLAITPKDKIGTAAELFADKRFKTIPVVNLDNELKGVVTAFDVIKSAFNDEYPRPILYAEEFGK
jgi:CBS-domain-containing membrane protein